MQKYLVYIFLTLIVLVAFVLRVYQNTSHPLGFFCDEAGLTYEAYSIATTGKDSLGNTFPFYINIFSPRGPVAVYDQIPFIWIFGMSEFTSRFISALYGTITIVLVFFLTYILSKNKTTAMFAALLTATSPWHIQFSRFGTENIRLPFYFGLFLLFVLLGIHAQYKHVIANSALRDEAISYKNNRSKLYVFLSIFFLFLAFYSYTAADVFLLPFLVGFVLIFRTYFFKYKRFSLILAALLILIISPFMYQMISSPQQSRFAEVSVFKGKTNQEAITAMVTTYLQSYSPEFLFFKGDAGMPGHFINRFSVKGFGELYLVALPFFLLGLWYVIRNSKKKTNQLLLLWLLLYPLGSVVAGADGGGPFATRSIIGALVFQIITASGITYFLSQIKEKVVKYAVIGGVTVLFVISCGLYIYAYFVQYPTYSEDFWGWQYGVRDIVQYFAQHQSEYDQEIMAPEFNAPDIFFKFYAPHDCQKCIVGLPQDTLNSNIKQIYAVTPEYLKQHPEFIFDMRKRLTYPNGTTAFLIGTIKKAS